jgi:hypothetical protein
MDDELAEDTADEVDMDLVTFGAMNALLRVVRGLIMVMGGGDVGVLVQWNARGLVVKVGWRWERGSALYIYLWTAGVIIRATYVYAYLHPRTWRRRHLDTNPCVISLWLRAGELFQTGAAAVASERKGGFRDCPVF